MTESNRLGCDWSILIRLSNMADFSDDEFTSSLKCVLQRFNIKRFRETQQETIVNFLKGKDVLVLQPTGSGKCLIFSLFKSDSSRQSMKKQLISGTRKMTNSLKRELRPVYFKSWSGLRSRFGDVADSGEPC